MLKDLKYVATSVVIVSDTKNEVITLPGNELKVKRLEKFVFVNGYDYIKEIGVSEADLALRGYAPSDYDHVVFKYRRGDDEFKVFSEGSPEKGDAQVPDVHDFYQDLVMRFIAV